MNHTAPLAYSNADDVTSLHGPRDDCFHDY